MKKYYGVIDELGRIAIPKQARIDIFGKSDCEGMNVGIIQNEDGSISIVPCGKLKNYYFTFGTSSQFPYHGGYLIVKAHNYDEVVEKYRAKYPDKNEGIINCAFIYTEEEWLEYAANSIDKPHEVIK